MKWVLKLNYAIGLLGVLIVLYDTSMQDFWLGAGLILGTFIIWLVAKKSPKLEKYL